MLQTDYVIGSPLNHQDPFILRHGSQLTANELPPFRLPFTSRRRDTSGLFFPGTSTGNMFETGVVRANECNYNIRTGDIIGIVFSSFSDVKICDLFH